MKPGPTNPLSARAPRASAPRGLPLRPAGALAPSPFRHLLAAAYGRAKPAQGQRMPPTTGAAAPSGAHAHSGPGPAPAPAPASASAQARGAKDARDAGEPGDEKQPRVDAIDPLDPSLRAAAHLAPPIGAPPASVAAEGGEQVAFRARISLEELLPLVVRRIAWGGDRTKAAVHVELASGAFAGTTVTVHAEGTRVRLEVGGTGDLDAIRERLEARLLRAGIDVERIT